ncbi:MAG: hypothetical protein AB1634_00735 [Thermodesulfobacteriota bacterium]
MDKLTHNAHARLQEMCDCYTDTDFAAEMARAAAEPGADLTEGGLKYLALALLHALSEKAVKLSFKSKKGTVTAKLVTEDGKSTLPAPSPALFAELVATLRSILHLEDSGASPLVLGLRSGQVDVAVKIKKDKDKESVKITLPPL